MENLNNKKELQAGEAVCEYCGAVVNEDGMYYVESVGWVCNNCIDEGNFQYCEECNTYHPRHEVRHYIYYDYDWWRREADLCDFCVEDLGIYYCTNCGRYVHSDNYNFDEGICNECYDDLYQTQLIEGWHSHKGDFYPVTLYGENTDALFGLELEMDDRSGDINSKSRLEIVKNINDILGGGDFVYFETDGSLSSRAGVEIISQPHSWQAWKKYASNWKRALKYASDAGYRSHDISNCGLHIHFDRSNFGWSEEEQAETLEKIILIYENNFSFFEKLARRNAGGYCRRYHTEELERDVLKKICKKQKYSYEGRYNAINNENRETVEFRLARGTLNYNTICAWIDLHFNLINNARTISEENMYNFELLLSGIEQNTLDYIVSRKAHLELKDFNIENVIVNRLDELKEVK